MKNKIIAIIVAIVLIIPLSRGWYEFLLDNFFDAELASSTQLKFEKISDTEMEVVGYDSDLHGSITIPEKIRIGLDIYKVTSIGASAFYRCSSLTSIKIPEGVTRIGSYAFWGCSRLTSINIPKGVTSIGKEAFSWCSRLTSIGGSAFEGCSSLTSIKIPKGVTSIGNWAFKGCSSLNSIKIPESVTSIGAYAFFRCSSLTSINIPESLTSIGKEAFWGCYNLEIVIDNSEKKVKVGWNAFENCKSVKWLK